MLTCVFLWLRMIMLVEDVPEINSYIFLQAQFTTSVVSLIGTLEDPELPAETANSLRARGVITVREAERKVLLSSYSSSFSLRGWVDPLIILSTDL